MIKIRLAYNSFFFTMLFISSNLSASPLLDYTESVSGNHYQYEFILTNDNIGLIDELYIDFHIDDPSSDFVLAGSPIGWDSFDGPGHSINAGSNYWVGWTAWFGSELDILQRLTSFSVTTSAVINDIYFSWNWDRNNVGLASTGSPVPEPATMILFGSGIAGLLAARRRKNA